MDHSNFMTLHWVSEWLIWTHLLSPSVMAWCCAGKTTVPCSSVCLVMCHLLCMCSSPGNLDVRESRTKTVSPYSATRTIRKCLCPANSLNLCRIVSFVLRDVDLWQWPGILTLLNWKKKSCSDFLKLRKKAGRGGSQNMEPHFKHRSVPA